MMRDSSSHPVICRTCILCDYFSFCDLIQSVLLVEMSICVVVISLVSVMTITCVTLVSVADP